MILTTPANLEDVSRIIQLSIAPIFLLTAVATTMVILTGRLSRIVDRGRTVEHQPHTNSVRTELRVLERRAHLIYRGIFLAVTAAILVCILMTVAFMSELFMLTAGTAVAVFFIAALFCYTGSLMFLLREVFLAIGNFRLGLKG